MPVIIFKISFPISLLDLLIRMLFSILPIGMLFVFCFNIFIQFLGLLYWICSVSILLIFMFNFSCNVSCDKKVPFEGFISLI